MAYWEFWVGFCVIHLLFDVWAVWRRRRRARLVERSLFLDDRPFFLGLWDRDVRRLRWR